MSAAAEQAAAALPDFVYELDALDWLVIAAAAVCVVVLVREYRRGGPLPFAADDPPEQEA